MRWRRMRDTPDVIDRRGARGGGGGLPFPGGVRAGGGLGIVGLLIFLAITLIGGGGGAAFDVDNQFGDQVQTPGEPGSAAIPSEQDPERDLRDFSAYVFTKAQDGWEQAFAEQGRPYERAKLVLYRDGVSTGCGSASSAVGPFYCPADQRVYLDLGFYGDMASQLGAQGDFAWAYVIAHEVGHHVQSQLGTSQEVRRLSSQDPDQANELSVRLELQADCFSGVWAHSVYTAGDLEEGDVEEATTAAAAVGDDRLQRRGSGRVDPDSFTHGSSEQRTRWFEQGRAGGEPADCDTFSADEV
jgi:predicted metalloprotease